MRIVINALSVHSGGGLVSLIELLPALREADKNNEYVVLMAEYQTDIMRSVPDGVRKQIINLSHRNVFLRVVFEQLLLPFVLWRIGADWLYSLGNQTVLLAPCKVCLVMENTNPYSPHPIAWSGRERVRLFSLRLLAKLSCWRATKVRFLTENSRRILSARLGISGGKTCVIQQGVRVRELSGGADAVGDSLGFPARYVLTVSNVAPHKNLECLMKGFDRFVERIGYEGSLVIAGGLLYREYYEILEDLRATLPSGEKMLFLGWVDQKGLGLLYTRADMFVFPSVEETFGIPLIEAMAYGTPVIASKAKRDSDGYFIPFEEICGDAAMYFNPFDHEDLAAQMFRLSSDLKLRNRLIKSGLARAHEFSWPNTAMLLSHEFSSN
jgi:glycosyltransferase involved in cell wall biosynthesis